MDYDFENLKSDIQRVFNKLDSKNMPKTPQAWLNFWASANDEVLAKLSIFELTKEAS